MIIAAWLHPESSWKAEIVCKSFIIWGISLSEQDQVDGSKKKVKSDTKMKVMFPLLDRRTIRTEGGNALISKLASIHLYVQTNRRVPPFQYLVTLI